MLGVFASVGWLWTAGVGLGALRPPQLGATLYTLFVAAATSGWAAGNITGWLRRRSWGLARCVRWCAGVTLGWLGVLAQSVRVGPGESGVYLPWLAGAIFLVLYLVPVTLSPVVARGPACEPKTARRGGAERE